MSCRPASSRQRDYAESLVEYLEKEQHRSAARFKTKVDGCDCIGEMSKLIDQLKEMREEIQDADRTASKA